MLIVKQYGTTLDALTDQPLVMMARNEASDDGLETTNEFVIQHHKKYSATVMFAENRHRKIANKPNLRKRKQ